MLDAAPAHLCTRCRAGLWDSELGNGRWACGRCEQTAFDQLRALPALFRRLDQISALMKGSSPGGIGSPTREAPAPLKIAVLNLTANGGVVARLQAIEDAWRAALGWTMGATRNHADIDGATTFLINNIRWACENYPEIADDLKTIKSLHERLKSLDTGEPRAKRFTIYCAGADCPGEMRVTLKSHYATCPDCGTEYDKVSIGDLDTEYGPNPNRQNAAA